MTNSSTTYMVFAEKLDFLIKSDTQELLNKEHLYHPDQKGSLERLSWLTQNWVGRLREQEAWLLQQRIFLATFRVKKPISDSSEKLIQPQEFRPELLVIVEKNSGRWLATYPCWKVNKESIEVVIHFGLVEGGAPDEIIVSADVGNVYTKWLTTKGIRIEYRSLLPDEILIVDQGLGKLNKYLQSELPATKAVNEKDLNQKLSDFIINFNNTTAHHSFSDETVLSFWKKYCHTRQVLRRDFGEIWTYSVE